MIVYFPLPVLCFILALYFKILSWIRVKNWKAIYYIFYWTDVKIWNSLLQFRILLFSIVIEFWRIIEWISNFTCESIQNHFKYIRVSIWFHYFMQLENIGCLLLKFYHNYFRFFFYTVNEYLCNFCVKSIQHMLICFSR